MAAVKIETGCHHVAMMEDLKAIAAKYDAMPLAEMVALTSQFIGGLVFMMDPDGFSPEAAGLMVLANMQEGNRNALMNSPVMNPQGSA